MLNKCSAFANDDSSVFGIVKSINKWTCDGLNCPVLDIGGDFTLMHSCHAPFQLNTVHTHTRARAHTHSSRIHHTIHSGLLHTQFYSIYPAIQIYVILGRCANKSHIMFDSLVSMLFVHCTVYRVPCTVHRIAHSRVPYIVCLLHLELKRMSICNAGRHTHTHTHPGRVPKSHTKWIRKQYEK